MPTVGAALIAAGWYVQYVAVAKRKHGLQKNFLVLYMAGAALLTLSSIAEFGLVTLLHFATALLAYLTLKKIGK